MKQLMIVCVVLVSIACRQEAVDEVTEETVEIAPIDQEVVMPGTRIVPEEDVKEELPIVVLDTVPHSYKHLSVNTTFTAVKTLDNAALITSWTQYLYDQKEVGPACGESCGDWMERYPDYYYGLQPMEERRGKLPLGDAILTYFPGTNCVCGNSYGADFGLLVRPTGVGYEYS